MRQKYKDALSDLNLKEQLLLGSKRTFRKTSRQTLGSAVAKRATGL
jgi:hypothetical protein